VRNDRQDYERTHRNWLERLKARRSELTAIVGGDVVSRYAKGIGLFTIGFHTGRMNLLRIALRRNDQPRFWSLAENA
jgi:cyclopropane-fatty-acyl-phospholipid synthase